MNRTTYLLLKIAEEAAEVAQMASKTAQFGTSERYQGGPSNLERLTDELRQLTTVCALLAQRQREVKGESFDFGDSVTIAQYDDDKVERVERYFKQAILNPDMTPPVPTEPEEPEPFDALQWAAKNLDTWKPSGFGGFGATFWRAARDAADNFDGFRIIRPGVDFAVELKDWVDARRALGLEAYIGRRFNNG